MQTQTYPAQSCNLDDVQQSLYIMRILMARPNITCSWGVSAWTVIKDGARFKVNGFKFRGYVAITYNYGTDLFDVAYFDESKAFVAAFEGLYIDQLQTDIDEYVEHTSDYESRVRAYYNL